MLTLTEIQYSATRLIKYSPTLYFASTCFILEFEDNKLMIYTQLSTWNS